MLDDFYSKMWLMLIFVWIATLNAKELIYYIDFEHPNITYSNPKYYEYVSLTAQRYSRLDPLHYVSFHLKSLIDFGNDAKVECYLYEFLSNEYRRSFLEFRYKLCDVFYEKKYDIFKPVYMKYVNASSCPFPKGEYHFSNISISNLPILRTFPFRKGRGFINGSFEHTGERLLEGYIDFTIKQRFL